MTNRTLTFFAVLAFAVFSAFPIYYKLISHEQETMKSEWQKRDTTLSQASGHLKALASRIQALQGEGKCEQDTDCQVVGLGTRTCGLYNDFLVYSTKDTQPAKFLGLVAEFNSLHEKVVDLNLAVNHCGRPPASARCAARRCTIENP